MKARAAGQVLVTGARSSGSVSALSFRLLAVLLLCLVGAEQAAPAAGAGERRRVDVGVILDRTTWLGNISWACMELALQDFYADASHASYSTRVRLHLRDTSAGPSAVDAASAGTSARSAYCCSFHFIRRASSLPAVRLLLISASAQAQDYMLVRK
jgi:hypothetical protein